jgi:hypothetical protein
MNMISTLTEDLIAYADCRPVEREKQTVLDEMILDYVDGELGSEVACSIEALMRIFPNVARLVADKTQETHLRNHLSMYFDGEFRPEASADMRRMIEGDPEVAKLARQIRQGGDYLRLVLQPIPGQHVSPHNVETIKRELNGATNDAAPIARFDTLVAYAMGMVIDKETQDLLDGMIIRYLDGTLDRVSTLGLEASMRLAPCVARLAADKADEQSDLSASTPRIRRRNPKNRAIRPDRYRSRHIDSL